MSTKTSLSDRVMGVAGRIGAQRHLVAIRDGFASIMPILIIGSLVTLINQIPSILNEIFKTELAWPTAVSTINGNVWWGTFGMLTLYVVFSLSYHLARSYDADGLSAGVVSLATYLSIVPQAITAISEGGEEVGAWGNVNIMYTDAKALFVGIIVGLLVTEIFSRLSKVDALKIKMPEGVPPAVGRSFSALFPGAITILSFVAVIYALEFFIGDTVFSVITKFVSLPLQGAADSLFYALLMPFLAQFLWFFGLHGSNILEAVIQPISIEMMGKNMEAFAAGLRGKDIPHIVTKPFLDTFVNIGGSGLTIGLLIAVFIVSKSQQQKTVSRLAIGPGLFNINEPIIFGFPIILNPIMFFPFIISPMVASTIAYVLTYIGFVPRTVAMVPWATPPIISGFLATGGAWQGVVVQIINVAVAALIYLPFVKALDKRQLADETAARSKA